MKNGIEGILIQLMGSNSEVLMTDVNNKFMKIYIDRQQGTMMYKFAGFSTCGSFIHVSRYESSVKPKYKLSNYHLTSGYDAESQFRTIYKTTHNGNNRRRSYYGKWKTK